MKYIFIVFLAGCGYAPQDYSKPVVVLEIQHKDKATCFCQYLVTGNHNITATLTSPEALFVDSCGRFQIGDTLQLKRKGN